MTVIQRGLSFTEYCILPLQIVGIGLCGVFELIKETRVSHPVLCARALQALLDMLQGQQPEGLKTEPTEVIGEITLISNNSFVRSHS